MITYLKPKIYYSDLYDEHTVEQCRRIEKNFAKEVKEYTGEKASAHKYVWKLWIYFTTGERYVRKESVIAEWMESDKAKDDKLRDTEAPSPIPCLFCQNEMDQDGRKYLSSREKADIDLVLFFYQCPKCDKRRAFWEDGKEFEAKSDYCKKCGGILNVEFKDSKIKMKTIYSCPDCGDRKESVHIKNKDTDKKDSDYLQDKEKYCLSDEEGWKYIKFKQDMATVSKDIEEMKEKEKNKHIYDAVAKLQKLKVSDLENLLNKKLKKENYNKLKFINTEIIDTVIVSFTIQDEKSGREEYNSRKDLEKLIKKTLLNTNWQLMSEGVNYRLGILSGRLKGYEREEDLIKLVNKQIK
ncbi:MAG TPA: hypothetical protein P5096_00780 [Patescibacteria group bacterium]|nr:hypothetical protein [Patescibacteria group bacterium]